MIFLKKLKYRYGWGACYLVSYMELVGLIWSRWHRLGRVAQATRRLTAKIRWSRLPSSQPIRVEAFFTILWPSSGTSLQLVSLPFRGEFYVYNLILNCLTRFRWNVGVVCVTSCVFVFSLFGFQGAVSVIYGVHQTRLEISLYYFDIIFHYFSHFSL